MEPRTIVFWKFTAIMLLILLGLREIMVYKSLHSLFSSKHLVKRVFDYKDKEMSIINDTILQNITQLPFKKYSLALGIFSAFRPNAPDYVYPEVMSILDSLFVNNKFINIDKIHVFDGSINGSQVKFFKYSSHIQVHRMDPKEFEIVKDFPVHRKASLNYLLTLRYLTKYYKGKVDSFLILEDDVIFDPDSAYIIWNILNFVKDIPLFLVDGYVKGPVHSKEEEEEINPLIPFLGDARCCSQAFLLSPLVAEMSIPRIENSLNGTEEYFPLDVFLTKALLKVPDFKFFFAKKCWVQHVGYPYLGLGDFHRGCSRMTFDEIE